MALVRNYMFSQASNRSALYTRYKSNKIGKPYRIPIKILFSGKVKSFIRSSINLFIKKL
jgi:hypothetical protein